jgi:hypothetical protein
VSEELLVFEKTIEGPESRSWEARVQGLERDDGLWEGWVQFTPVDGGAPVRTDRETTQPNLHDLQYWASGLTYFFLEGALERALRRQGD